MKNYFLFIILILFFIGCDKEEYSDYNPTLSPDCSYIDSTQTCCNQNDLDCANICFGNSSSDCAGNCNGNGILDSDGDCCSSGIIDDCGICNGPGFLNCQDNTQVCSLDLCSGCNDITATNYNPNGDNSENCIYDEAYNGWNVIWNDEFNSNQLNLNKWDYQFGTGSQFGLDGWGNQEEQYYTNNSQNIRIENGELIIQAINENIENSEYTSARIYSIDNWTYGRVDIKAKLPTGKGTWPAFWMLPQNESYGGWPSSGEIDIMEHVGCDLGRVFGSIHCDDYNHQDNTQQTESVPNIINVNDYHVYRIDWNENHIKWYIDDNLFFTFNNDLGGSNSWPFDKDFYLILNLAVGGTFGTLGGDCEFDSGEVDQQQIIIDYVRILKEETN